MDGIKALKTIREMEENRGIALEKRVKVIIMTALGETDYVMSAFKTGLEAYMNKPIETDAVEELMIKLKLI